MTEPVASDELTQGVKDAQAKFDEGMGAAGDASPYPMLAELRASAAVHRGWPEMGIPPSPDGEMQEPEHALYRKLHEFAFARSSMRRWEADLVRPLVERTVDRFAGAKRADLVEEVFMPIPVRVIAALIGLPEADIPEFHRLAIDLLGFHSDMESAMKASGELKEYFIGILADRRREPKDDMVSVLAASDIDGVRMSDEQIYGFMRNLLPAGAETTSRSTASLALGLLTHPDQLAAVVADRGLLAQAIEEG